MNEQRRDVLQMLAEGKITAEEADQLIAALDRDRTGSVQPGAEAADRSSPRYLRVVVVDPMESAGGEGHGRVNIRVPLQLLRAGVRLASLIPPKALGQANEQLRKSGVPFDLSQLNPEHLETLVEHLHGMTVDVDQPDAKVHIFCE